MLFTCVVFNCQNSGERSGFFVPYIYKGIEIELKKELEERFSWRFVQRQINVRYCFVPRLFDYIAVGLPFLMSL